MCFSRGGERKYLPPQPARPDGSIPALRSFPLPFNFEPPALRGAEGSIEDADPVGTINFNVLSLLSCPLQSALTKKPGGGGSLTRGLSVLPGDRAENEPKKRGALLSENTSSFRFRVWENRAI